MTRRLPLIQMLEALPIAGALLDTAGRLLGRNQPLRMLLDRDPSRDAVAHGLEEAVARVLTAPLRAGRAGPVALEVRGHRFRAAVLDDPELPGDLLLVVLVESSIRQRPSVRALCQRFDLSEREAEVALLMTDGLRNEDIAAKLEVTNHTIRHHTERIFRKLGVRNRARAVAVIHGAEPGPPRPLRRQSRRRPRVEPPQPAPQSAPQPASQPAPPPQDGAAPPPPPAEAAPPPEAAAVESGAPDPSASTPVASPEIA